MIFGGRTRGRRGRPPARCCSGWFATGLRRRVDFTVPRALIAVPSSTARSLHEGRVAAHECKTLRVISGDSRVASMNCTLCRGAAGDEELDRVQVWEDPLWRLTTSRSGEVAGFSFLEPKRHIPHMTDLDGEEAKTFGTVLARTTRAIRDATGAEVVYIYVFGEGIPHLHLHLAPHREGDPLNNHMIRGELIETPLPSGATAIVSRDFPQLPASRHEEVRERIRRAVSRP